jgi:hypothetical protein
MAQRLITGSTDGLGLMAAELQEGLLHQCARLTGVALPQPMNVLLERDRQLEREACAGPGEPWHGAGEAGPIRAGQ